MLNRIQNTIEDLVECLKDQNPKYTQSAGGCVEATSETIMQGGKIFFCGNGGSCATASHISNDLACHMKNWERVGYQCICLNDSPAVITSLSNDYGYEKIFEKQITALGKAGDILWGFSSSGNSKNVVNAVLKAKEIGITTVAFTGRKGGALKDVADIWIPVNSDDVLRIEEMHVIYAHSIAVDVEETVSPMNA